MRKEWQDRVDIGEISAKAGMMSINGTGKDKPDKEVKSTAEKNNTAATKIEKKVKADTNATTKYAATPLDLPTGLVKVGSDESYAGLISLPAQVFSISPSGDSRTSSPDIFSILNSESETIDTATASSPTKCYLRRVKCVSGTKAFDRIIQIELDTKPSMISLLVPGDSIGVVCPNPDFLVDLLNQRLGLDPDALINIASCALDDTSTSKLLLK
jgi:sulfite reductase alpha subunit-like flavoprotein